MCNLARRGGADSLRERPGYEYGIEGPDDPAEPFAPPYFDSYGNPAGPYDVPESIPLFHDYSVQQPPARVPVQRPRENQPQPVDPYAGECLHPSQGDINYCMMLSHAFFLTCFCVQSGRYDAFEGLRAEECGILNGCENGRCVRVREGYTCDCFDGYEFNLGKMACIGGLFFLFSSQQLLYLITGHLHLHSAIQEKKYVRGPPRINSESIISFNLVCKMWC